ncbi:hypothetical protein CUR178_03798 [Leishmania enriettii]|uniref:Uncharacterized protein n=1 Tax=Leishmania enriettii TaxID=5663 RepID=A0A836GK91_LEIEN|nr:hypothetical protein CUR178_03798 [Leishmania enriettii]
METVAVENGPCDLCCALGAVASGDSSLKGATLLCVASTACCGDVAPPVSRADAAAATGTSCAARVPAWLSVTVTCALDVFIQVHPSLSPDGFADLLGCCHGVTERKSKPHFARVTCDNVRSLCALHDGIIALPLSPADVVAKDVSTCSTSVKAATLLHEPTSKSALGGCMRSRTASASGGGATRLSSRGAAELGCCSTDVVSRAAERLGISTLEATACVARSLPTVALLVRFPQRCRRALVLLRPSVGWRHKKYRVTYRASVSLVSESVQRVALMPRGDAAVLLSDTFIEDASSPPCASDEVGGASATLVLRGNLLFLHDFEQRSDALQPLRLHLGLRGLSARQRVLRSLLRCRVTGAWCRLRFPACGAGGAPCCSPAASELALYTSEGHALVFERVLVGMSHGSVAVVENDDPSLTVVYTCCVGTHLLFSKLDASAAAASTAVSRPSDGVCGGALLVAPPYRFADQWRHSLWFAKTLALTTTPSVALSGVLTSSEGRRRRRRHRASSVIAMSPNRRVWLVRAGLQLCVVSLPTGTGAMAERDDVENVLTSAVQLDSSHILHDAQYVACGGQAGFLLLCRHNSAGAAESWDTTSAMSPVMVTSAMGDRFVHCSRPQNPVRLLFLSLTATGIAAAASAAAIAAISPLLPVPLIPSAALVSLPPSFTLPSSRLRLVCAVSAAGTLGTMLATENMSDTLYVVISSSGDARCAWKVTVRLPSVWSSGASLLHLGPSEGTGVAGGGSTAAAGASRAASALQWTAHSLSALFPHACLMRDDGVVGVWKAAVQGTAASSLRCSPLSAVEDAEEVWTPEAALEAALLELKYPYDHGTTSPAYAADAPPARGAHTGAATPYDSPATVAFHDALHAFSHACFSGDEASTAGAVAVFAGFSAALRMSGLLVRCRDHRATRDGGVLVTLRIVAFLHGCAQLLRHAMEDIAAVGDVSALLACVSHLTPTVAARAERMSPPTAAPAAWEVWGHLLQPLFDFVWGVVRAYGVPVEVATGLLEYCSPAVRSMVHARAICWPDGGNILHATQPSSAASPEFMHEAPRHSRPVARLASPGSTAKLDGAELPSAPCSSGPVPALSSPIEAAAASSYTSTELYEMVQRVFLLQGAAAALRLLSDLQRHESTKAGATEMAQVLEAIQQRLRGVAV